MNEATKVALYARVSTSGKGQNPELQLDDLRSVALQRKWNIVGEFIDEGISGSKDRRPSLDRLMNAVHEGKVDVVAVWRFDRFARSTRHLLEVLETFRVKNVDFFSLREQVDTSTPAGKALFTMIAAVAELERDLICERVKAGIERAKSKGIKLGRPKRKDLDVARIKRLLASGKSLSEISRFLEIPRSTLQSTLKRADEKPLRQNQEIASINP